MKLTSNAKIILKRFLKKNETPEQMLKRVSKNIAKEDKRYKQNPKESEKQFYEVMDNLEFLPNLPTLANAGRELQQLAACFVLPVGDSMQEIFQSVRHMALIQKSGGGTGFSFSHLRPTGSKVKETGGIASGPVSFMRVFDCATAAIKEGGIRRGANMGVLRIDHPDIEKFITSKETGGLTNFNISVAITNNFIKAVQKNQNFSLIFNNKVYKKIRARKLFDQIAKHTWQNGEPGVIFIDEVNKKQPTPKIGKIESTNPCGEVPLLPYEACILGSINLTKFVNQKIKTIDYKKLENVIQVAVHFLDNSIDATKHPLPQIEKIVKANRKIGLGVMGFADMLIMLEIPYDSREALDMANKIMKFIQSKAKQASQELAKKRSSFPNINKSIYKGKKMRNSTVTTMAPTGTISIFADCSQGIEPLFDLKFKRHSTYGTLHETSPLLKKADKKKIKRIFRTSHDISPEWHVKIQAAFQKYTDNAVSKTVNLPEKTTYKDIEKIYLLAHKLRCKGLTVYRYNSREKQILVCKKCKI